MLIQIALTVSVLLQFGAFFITISLIPKTKFNVAWISISIGFLLMALRRVNDLFIILDNEISPLQSDFNSWVAVIISVTMFIASFYIRKIFEFLNRLNNLQKENEARVLSAILSTEENERKFFAKELHDGLGPILSSMKMSLSALNEAELGKENRELVHITEHAIDHAIVTTREISNHLNPLVLERFGLEKAIKAFIGNGITSKNLKIDFNANIGNERFKYDIEVILYRILCELINNTVKHASATQAAISLLVFNGRIECIYEDNGIGFDRNIQQTKGMGLLNIQSRIKSVNGTVELESQARKGVYVKIDIPL